MSVLYARFRRPCGLFGLFGGGSPPAKPPAKPGAAPAKPAAPVAKLGKVMNPRTAPPGHDLFVLRVAPTCTLTSSLNGHYYTRHNAIPLPMATCQPGCGCHYDEVRERRKGDRRKATDRRESIRFEERTDRRQRDRRDPNPWTRGKAD